MFSKNRVSGRTGPHLKLAVLAIAPLLLAGCFDSSPSAGDMRGAVQKMLADLGRGIMQSPAPRITDFERIGCTPDGENTYVCRFRFRAADMGMLELALPPGQVHEARFVRTRDGWQAMRSRR